jgi:heterotetrameric sarcosine oxidase gamma subunit
VSAPELALATFPADVVELAALRRREAALAAVAARRGLALPEGGGVATTQGAVALAVRPARWLLLSAPAATGSAAAHWAEACTGAAVAVDLSCALAALHLAGPAAPAVLARGCRLDLELFPAGRAAATIIAQVAVILAALPSGMLILTPASTARHLREWLAAAARPFGLTTQGDITLTALSGDPYS